VGCRIFSGYVVLLACLLLLLMYEFADLEMCSLLTEKLGFVGCSVLKSSHLEIRRLER